MKKASLLSSLIALALMLSACGSGNASRSNFGGAASSGDGFRSSRNSSAPLTPELKLALGTMKLEGTKQAVNPAMAAKLVPLWQLMVQLNSSNSSAPQEVTAVVDQIQATMEPDQLNTIDGMKLTQGDLFSVFQQQAQADGAAGTSNAGGQGSSSGNRAFGGGFGGGGFGGGGFGGGGFGGGGFGGASRSTGGTGSNAGSLTSSSLTAAQAAQARQNAISSLVIGQLIRLLETKLSS